MRTPLLAGNMKMFKTSKESAELAEGLKKELKDVKSREIALCPNFIALRKVCGALKDSNIGAGAQNLYWEKEGAFTGEVSAGMIAEIGCKYVIIGHSERRQYFGETNQTVNKKITAAVEAGLIPIICVGETLAERESGKTLDIIGRQIKEGLENIQCKTGSEIVVAYEPVWAIGTGKTATPEMAQDVHKFIRDELKKACASSADNIRILYGGSVKPENISSLMKMADIDGALVGGACLKVDSFTKIVKYE